MEVILTEDVPKLGNAGDVVRVRDGFGRNFLLPRGMALLATAGRVRDVEHKRRVIDEKQRKEIRAHEDYAQKLGELAPLEFRVQVGEEGKLFGSVTSSDIAEQIAARGLEVDRRKLELAEPIKQVGDYEVPVRLHRAVTARVKVRVQPIETPEAAVPD